MSKRSQAVLRGLIQRATLPAVTVKELGQEAHLSPQTIGKFIRGQGITEEQEDSLRRALLNLLPRTNR